MLTARQRQVVVPRHVLDLSEHEVAADLGISTGIVTSTSSRRQRSWALAAALDGSTGARLRVDLSPRAAPDVGCLTEQSPCPLYHPADRPELAHRQLWLARVRPADADTA